jgi:iron-sulfur cluster insertion protein
MLFEDYNKAMTQEKNIILTDALVGRVRALQKKQGNQSLMLRIAINGGGCQGFEYQITMDDHREDDDNIFEKDGITVLVDDVSLDLLDGATIDFIDEMAGAAFKIINPNAKSSCGCGTSFAV